MRKLYFCILLSIFFTSIHATPISWLGGSGHWNNPQKWSTGTIPSWDDAVSIPDNSKVVIPNNYQAKSASVDIASQAKLVIDSNAELGINCNSNFALRNAGDISQKGDIVIGGNVNLSIGIINSGEIWASQAANIIIKNVSLGIRNESVINSFAEIAIINTGSTASTGGIFNSSNAKFTNYSGGEIDFYDIGGTAITNYVEGLFKNYGQIDFNSNINLHAIQSDGIFLNEGELKVLSFSSVAIYNLEYFENKGSIIFPGNSTYGIAIQNWMSYFVNEGSIIIQDPALMVGIYNYGNDGQFDNKGIINIEMNGDQGIACGGWSKFDNEENGKIQLSGDYFYAISVDYAFFKNAGGNIDLDINSGYSFTVFNTGSAENLFCGRLNINRPILLYQYGSFRNFSWMEIAELDAPHDNNAYFTNYGVISDRYESLATSGMYNYGIIVDPLDPSTGVTEGIPVSNALWRGSLSNYITVANQWTSQENGGFVVGNYNSSSNTFTPSNNSAGISTVWIEFEYLLFGNCSNSQTYPMDIPGGILPNGSLKDPKASVSAKHLDNGQEDAIRVFPNPVGEELHLILPEHLDQPIKLELYNQLGQKVLNQVFDPQSNAKVRQSIPDHLQDGLYVLRLSSKKAQLFEQKILILH